MSHPTIVEAYEKCTYGCASDLSKDKSLVTFSGRGYPPLTSNWRNTKYYLYKALPGEKGTRCFCLDKELEQEYEGDLICLTPVKCGLCYPKDKCKHCDKSNRCKKIK